MGIFQPILVELLAEVALQEAFESLAVTRLTDLSFTQKLMKGASLFHLQCGVNAVTSRHLAINFLTSFEQPSIISGTTFIIYGTTLVQLWEVS